MKTSDAISVPADQKPSTPAAFVFAALLEGQRTEEIRKELAKHFPRVKFANVLAEVRKQFAEIANGDPVVLRGWCIASAQDLHGRMISVGEYEGALKAIKLVHEVAGKKTTAEKAAEVTI